MVLMRKLCSSLIFILAFPAVLHNGCGSSSALSPATPTPPPPATATVVGADVGWLTQLQSMGYTWTDTTGASGNALQILKNHGVNTIRIRTFVNPTITAGVLGVGNNDQAGSIALAVLANSMDFKIMIDFHQRCADGDPGGQCRAQQYGARCDLLGA
jgi:arabinogalactan endo-1,4-beta-galactosidase